MENINEPKPVGQLKPYKPKDGDIKPVGELKPYNPNQESDSNYEQYLSGTKSFDSQSQKPKQEEIFGMVDRLPEMPGDTESKKQIIKDLIASGAKAEEVTQTIETLRGVHPKQKGGFKYYINEKGVASPLANDEKPPEGYRIASLFGSEADAKDDNIITDIAKTAWNIFPSVAGDLASLANTGVQLVTGEKSDNLTSLENSADYLKLEKDPDIQGSLLKTENIKNYGDILKGENWDLSPKTIWGTALNLGQSLAEFAVPASIAGKAVKGASWATKILPTGEKVLSTAGEIATSGVASFIINQPEIADAAEKAGLKGREAAFWTLATTGLISTLDVKLGLGPKIFRNTAIKEEKDAFLTAMAKKVLGKTEKGELSKEALDEAINEILTSYPKLAKTWLKESGADAVKEGLQESGQEAIKGLSQQFWDGVTDEDKAKFGTDITSPESVANLLNQFVSGAIGGAPTAVAFNKVKQIEKDNNQSKTVFGVVQQGDEAIKNFKRNVEAAKESGELTPEQAQDAITRVNAYKEYNDYTTSLDLDSEKKRESFDLTFQKQNLESQLEAMGDPKKLNPLEQAQYSGIEKQANDIQKRINEIVTEAQVKDEKVVTEKTIKDIEKQNQPPKEGENKAPVSPEKKAMLDKYKDIAKEGDKRKLEDVPVEEINSDKIAARDKQKMFFTYIAKQPNRKADGVVAQREVAWNSKPNSKNTVFGAKMKDGKVIRFSSSAKRKDQYGRGWLEMSGKLPKSVMVENSDGSFSLDETKLEGKPIGFKAVSIKNNKEGKPDKSAIKIFLKEPGKDYGKFIAWAKESQSGNADYTGNETVQLEEEEKLIEPFDEAEVTPTEPTPPPIDFNKLAKEAVSEKELDAVIDQADKAEYELDFTEVNKKREEFNKPEKPSVKMEFVSSTSLAKSKSALETKKKHDKVKEKFKDLKKLIDCLWT